MAIDAYKMVRVTDFLKALDTASRENRVAVEGIGIARFQLVFTSDDGETFPLTARYDAGHYVLEEEPS